MKILPFLGGLLAAMPLAARVEDLTPYPNCKSSFYAEIDYLLWYANQEGMSYASRANFGKTADLSASSLDQNDQFFKNKWSSGVRATLGYQPASKTWDSHLIYTHFNGKNHPKKLSGVLTTNNYDEPLVGTAILPSYIETPLEGNPSTYTVDPLWKLSFNALDLEFGKEFFASYDACLRPFFGLRGLWTNQTFDEYISLTPGSDNTGSFTHRNQFTGVGARAGLDIDYTLGYGIHLYGNFAAGILWGLFKVQQKSILEGEDIEHSHQSSVYSFDIGLGLRWNYHLNNDRDLLTIKVGWEQHLFNNINQFQNFSISTGGGERQRGGVSGIFTDRNIQRGNLSLSGFTVGVSYSL